MNRINIVSSFMYLLFALGFYLILTEQAFASSLQQELTVNKDLFYSESTNNGDRWFLVTGNYLDPTNGAYFRSGTTLINFSNPSLPANTVIENGVLQLSLYGSNYTQNPIYISTTHSNWQENHSWPPPSPHLPLVAHTLPFYNSSVAASTINLNLSQEIVQRIANGESIYLSGGVYGNVFCSSDHLPFGPCNFTTQPKLQLMYRINQPPLQPNILSPIHHAQLSTLNCLDIVNSECLFEVEITTEDHSDDYPLQLQVVATSTDGLEISFTGKLNSATVFKRDILLPEGIWELKSIATDRHGLTSTPSSTKNISIDITPPEITALDIDKLLNKEYVIMAAGYDDHTEIQYEVSSNDFLYTTPWQKDGLAISILNHNQRYILRFRVRDDHGNISAYSEAYEFTTDFENPDIIEFQVVKNYMISVDQLSLKYKVVDLNFEKAEISILNEAAELITHLSTQNPEATLSAQDFALDALDDGIYEITLEAFDLAGNRSMESLALEINKNGGQEAQTPRLKSAYKQTQDGDVELYKVGQDIYSNAEELFLTIESQNSVSMHIESHSDFECAKTNVESSLYTCRISLTSSVDPQKDQIELFAINKFGLRSRSLKLSYQFDTLPARLLDEYFIYTKGNRTEVVFINSSEPIRNFTSNYLINSQSTHENRYTLTFFIPAVADGLYIEELRFEDFAGNKGSASVHLSIDNEAPSIPIFTGYYINALGQLHKLIYSNFHRSPASHGMKEICIEFEQNATLHNPRHTLQDTLYTPEQSRCLYTFIPSSQLNSHNYFSLYARDRAGNRSPLSREFSVYLDNLAPDPPRLIDINATEVEGRYITSEGTVRIHLGVEPYSTLYQDGKVLAKSDIAGISTVEVNLNPDDMKSVSFQSVDEVGNTSSALTLNLLREPLFHGGLLRNPYNGSSGKVQSVSLYLEISADGKLSVIESNLEAPEIQNHFLDINSNLEVYVTGISKISSTDIKIKQEFYSVREGKSRCGIKDRSIPAMSTAERNCVSNLSGIENLLSWSLNQNMRCRLNRECLQRAESLRAFKLSEQLVQEVALYSRLYKNQAQFGWFHPTNSIVAYNSQGRAEHKHNLSELGLKIGDWVKVATVLELEIDVDGRKFKSDFGERKIESSLSRQKRVFSANYMVKEGKRLFINPTPYFNQWMEPAGGTFPRDGWQMCGAASVSMATAFYTGYGRKDFNDDHLYKAFMYSDNGQGISGSRCGAHKGGAFEYTNFGCNSNSWWGMEKYMHRSGYRFEPVNLADRKEVEKALEKEQLIVTGYSGDVPGIGYFGHFALIVGYSEDGQIVVHDPFTDTDKNGVKWSGYDDGKYAVYPPKDWKFKYKNTFKIVKN